MPFEESDLGGFGSLTHALGITDGTSTNAHWFDDPLGGSTKNANGLRTILSDEGQRTALETFVDEVLGPPDAHDEGPARWIPLFTETDPDVAVFAVVEPTGSPGNGTVQVGVGVEATIRSTDPPHPSVSLRAHVPVAQVPRGTTYPSSVTGDPRWLVLGRPGGRIGIELVATFTEAAPVPREAFLRGARLSVGIPTAPGDGLELVLELTDLQLPGAATPTTQTLSLDDLATVGPDLLEFLVGLVRAQVAVLDPADAALRHVVGLAGALGLRPVADIPELPLADLSTRGVAALVEWLEGLLTVPAARAAWLGELALMTGFTPDATALTLTRTVAPVRVVLGLDVRPGTGGHPVLVPRVELALDTRAGASVSLGAELLRLDTGTGTASAFPSVLAEAVFGADAGGGPLLTGTPHVGSLHLGVGLDADRHPELRLFATDVDLTGSHVTPVVDLSSPDAVVDAAEDELRTALTQALAPLGEAGDVLATLLGLTPPTGVPAPELLDLCRDPLGTMRGYWDALTASDTMAEVLGTVRRLLLGVAAVDVPGDGSADDPWALDLGGAVDLLLWRDGPLLVLGLQVAADLDVLDDLTAAAGVSATLLTLRLDTGTATFLDRATGSVGLGPRGTDPARLDLGPVALEFRALSVTVGWSPGAGLRAAPAGTDLVLRVDGTALPVPLPTVGPDGRWSFAPDWAEVEDLLGQLGRRLGLPAVTALLDLLGWDGAGGSGAHLPLGDLVADPAAALETWLLDGVLDCDHLAAALGPVAWVLSGGTLDAPLGGGRPDAPWRCPVGGDPASPGLSVRTEPGCPGDPALRPATVAALGALRGSLVPTAGQLAEALRSAGADLADLGDLVHARTRLDEGLATLVGRWVGTDGLVGSPATRSATGGHTVLTADEDVEVVVLPGFTAAALGASARRRGLALPARAPGGPAAVHVGCDPLVWAAAPAASRLDLTVASPATLPATGDGPWFLLLPTGPAAAATRTDHDGVRAQAELLAAALAPRTAPVLLVGHGGAGAATVLATSLPGIAAVAPEVVTVGTPWGPVSSLALATGLGGDAFRLLRALVPAPAPVAPDDAQDLGGTALQQAHALVARGAAGLLADPDLPSPLGLPRGAGVRVTAVFGTFAEDAALRALAALVAQGVEDRRLAAAAAPSGLPERAVVGVDLPAVDADLGGVSLGVAARLDLLAVARTAPRLTTLRSLSLDLRFALDDGWLVGGPGASSLDLEARWLDVRLDLPFDGGRGTATLTLHEARAYAAYRERWVVTGDDVGALPEARILLSAAVSRMLTVPGLGDLLTALGLVRDGGLDPTGLDHLLYDPAATVRGAVRAAPATVAAALRTVLGSVLPSGRPASEVTLGSGAARVTLDLATARVTGHVDLTSSGVPLVADLAVRLTLDDPLHPADVGLTAALGAFSGTGSGVRVALAAGTAGVSVSLEQGMPGGVVHAVPLYPDPDAAGLLDVLVPAVPAVLLAGVAQALRERVTTPLLEDALAALGLLGPEVPDVGRALVVPSTLLRDPVAWLRAEVDPVAASVAVLDALAPVLAPGRGSEPGWPVTPELTIGYAAVAGRLELTARLDLAATVGGSAVAATVLGGLSVGTAGPPLPLLDARVTVEGRGLELAVGTGPVPVRLDLVRPAPLTALGLYPPGAGLAGALADTATSLLKPVLDELLDRASGAAGLPHDVGVVVDRFLLALDLLDAGGHLDLARVQAFVAPPGPGAALLARLPALAGAALQSLADALDPAHTLVEVSTAGTVSTIHLGRLPAGPGAVRPFSVGVDGSVTAPAVVLGCDVALGDVGRVAVEELRIDAHGLRVAATAGPFAIDVGPSVVRPLLTVRAGVTDGTFTPLVGLGLALEGGASPASVQIRFSGSGVELWNVTAGPSPTESQSPEQVAAGLVGVALGMASGFVADQLGDLVSARITRMLQGVVLTGGGLQVDPALVTDLVHAADDPTRLLARLERLAWNCATDAEPPSVTFGGVVTVALAANPSAPGAPTDPRDLGLRVTIPDGRTWVVADGETKVEIVAHADWITGEPPSGLSVYLLHGTADALVLLPGVLVAGLGVRVGGTSRPLLDLGALAIDAIEVDVYGEATATGVGGGARIKLDGLAVAPGGQGQANPMAGSIMADVGASSGTHRPTFSPSVAVQKHPGDATAGVTLRAGDPPGPWWLVIQRQLGPLYVDRIGLDTTESGGTVTSVSLLFSGGLSIFGFSAAVDRLSIGWTGGDPLDARNWSVDLMGLAISADLSGASIAGGLLKIVDDGEIGYLGMLVGRFAAYGLSVFGGYSRDAHGNASFFVFGAVNGPFGGPPAFFLTGIGGGLGINRGMRIPSDISTFGDFPFISALDASRAPKEPMQQLQELREYFPAQQGQFWFAAGISFTSFSLVDGIAVLAVSFGNGLDVNLFGFARLALPRPQACIVNIELALLAHFSTEEGVFLIQAQLTDNSWLLYSDVRLTGGFAFAVWWKGPLAGQFVLTLGGYHPDFPVPVGYPDVPRLGLVWSVSDAITIKGGSYFALTSEALMAGLSVEVSVDFGFVWARIAFGVDAIVWFDPFWYEASAYARISAGLKISLPWPIGDISISITIGASVKVWGPEFAGHAEFEIGPCTVPVDFGSRDKALPDPIDWMAFVGKYLESAGDAARALSAITGLGTLPTSTSSPQGAPTADGSSALPFQVFAEFELVVTTTVPATAVDVAGVVTVPVRTSSGAPTGVGIAPMGADGLSSTLGLSLERLDGTTWTPSSGLTALGANLRAASADPAGSRLGTDSFPLGVWGPAKTLGTAQTLPSTEVVTAGNRVTLVAQVSATPVGSPVNYYRVEAGPRRPLPLHATGATRARLLSTSAGLGLPTPTTADAALAVAAAALFPTRTALFADRQHSELARAAYRRDRVAPPRIADLTDGLAKVNGPDGARPGVPVPETVRPTPRRPFVGTYLRAGTGARSRPSGTTVADGRPTRRPAPGVADVQGRMGLVLPATIRVTPTPGRADGDTVVATSVVPRTGAVGTVRSASGARVGSPELAGLVAGLGPLAGRSAPTGPRRSRAARAALAGTRLRSGDLVALELPDARIDTDPDRRPTLTVDGTARVVTVVGRRVAADVVVTDGTLAVPPGAGLVAVQADGAPATNGCAGWTAASRVARLGSHLALGPGCTLAVEGPAAAGRDWATASAATAGATLVTTWFATAPRTLAVALTGTVPTAPTPTDLAVVGAELATGPDGRALPPVAVVLGASTVLLHALEPGAAGPVGLQVRPGGAWQVVGTLASDLAPADLAVVLGRQGLDGTVARVLAATGDGCEVTWTDAPTARPRRTRRPR